MTLRQEMLKTAERQLDAIIGQLLTEAAGYTFASAPDLLRLAAGGRTDTLRKKVCRQMVSDEEAVIVKKYNNQVDAFDEKAEGETL